MEKTIVIDGKEVKFKSNGSTALRYKVQFGRDYLTEIFKLKPLLELDPENLTAEDIANLDSEVFYNLVWSLAKTADNTIPDLLTWLDTFDTFPIFEILPDLQEMIVANITQSKKK